VTSTLTISGLRAGAGGQEILRGIDLSVSSGQVHAVMGPNGSGKSTLAHVVMGRPGYEVLAGQVTLDGVDLLGLPPWKRAQAGLFLAMQYPTEVPGVSLEDALTEALLARGEGGSDVRQALLVEAGRIGFDERFVSRPLNVDLSGGEMKRNETLQLAVLRPKIAVLDEIDSGLDIDALRTVSRRVEEATRELDLGVLVITHYSRMLLELKPDVVSVLQRGRVVATGGPELADELERTGYAGYEDNGEGAAQPAPERPTVDDPFGDPLA
jgi:Fe-S cluster assembly ATP-binding protein